MAEFSESKTKDMDVIDCLYRNYEMVGREKKNLAKAWENRRQRMGLGSKIMNGRMDEPGSKDADDAILFMRDLVRNNGLDPIMDELETDDLQVCYGVFEADPREIGRREDEGHLYRKLTTSVKSKVDVVMKKLEKITLKQWTSFSCALAILDGISAACLRPQDSLGCKARDFHIVSGLLQAVLPEEVKNTQSLLRSAHGLVVNHAKHSSCKGAEVL